MSTDRRPHVCVGETPVPDRHLLGGLVAYLVVLSVMLGARNLNYFPAPLLIGSITVPTTVLVFAEEGGRFLPVLRGRRS